MTAGEDGPAALRRQLRSGGLLVAPGCHDALGARIAEAEGFPAVYMSGNATSASRIGKPDVGLLSLTEMVTNARGIVSAVSVPVISDADTGYGDANSIARTIAEFEAAGVAGVHIEDQAMPKKCGAMPGVRLVPRDEACQRLAAALSARSNPDFVVIARTDALATDDYDEAIWRGRAFADMGADLVMVEDVRSRADVENIARDLAGVPLLTDVLEFWPWTLRPLTELEKLGYRAAIFCLSGTLAYAHAAREVYRAIRDNGDTHAVAGQMFSREEYEGTLGLQLDGTLSSAVHQAGAG